VRVGGQFVELAYEPEILCRPLTRGQPAFLVAARAMLLHVEGGFRHRSLGRSCAVADPPVMTMPVTAAIANTGMLNG
jgi:hypothetical protein